MGEELRTQFGATCHVPASSWSPQLGRKNTTPITTVLEALRTLDVVGQNAEAKSIGATVNVPLFDLLSDMRYTELPFAMQDVHAVCKACSQEEFEANCKADTQESRENQYSDNSSRFFVAQLGIQKLRIRHSCESKAGG
ncbi:uncharacterized protein CC84DRAFT_1172501 [Paraphaeosphaeria sporulosa]|uniref:Uncharacterized protein n=1 Tax=Paraphaeosphaeria sporulosa TaxID=1460663 RepID=A0A177CSX5_9PLEO|nr:uncharacterized protein CC84DRAFT_1172501 [Paraphaeosphaeria sporulosa]OAG10022.1 hypothetical protein CC84DRAFT_1172501 [Paraphaeosphaeria sporulosa]